MILSNDKNQLDRKTAKNTLPYLFIYYMNIQNVSPAGCTTGLYSRLYNLFARAARRPAADRTRP